MYAWLKLITNRLLIASWNVHGNLPIKMRDPDFIAELTRYDVVMMQETHLRFDQADQLPTPSGYTMHCRSRDSSAELGTPGGGLAVLARTHLGTHVLDDLSDSELMVVTLASVTLTVVNVYWAPVGSCWLDHDGKPVGTRLRRALARTCNDGFNTALVLGDFNARTGTRTRGQSQFHRLSPDNSTSRGTVRHHAHPRPRDRKWHVLPGSKHTVATNILSSNGHVCH